MIPGADREWEWICRGLCIPVRPCLCSIWPADRLTRELLCEADIRKSHVGAQRLPAAAHLADQIGLPLTPSILSCR
jgi:hypothetical protein